MSSQSPGGVSSQPPGDDAPARPSDSALGGSELDGSELDGSVLGQAAEAQHLSVTFERPNARMLEAENAALIDALRALNEQVRNLKAERNQRDGRIAADREEAPQEWPAQQRGDRRGLRGDARCAQARVTVATSHLNLTPCCARPRFQQRAPDRSTTTGVRTQR